MSDKLKVLVLEDDEDDALLTIRELASSGFEVEHLRVDDREGLEDALQGGIWNVVLCDYVMPGFTALDALAIVRRSGIDLPFIIVSTVTLCHLFSSFQLSVIVTI